MGAETVVRGCLEALDEAENLRGWERGFVGDMVDKLASDDLAQKPFEWIFTENELRKIMEIYDERCC